MHKLSLVAAMGVVAVMARAHAAPLEISNQPEAASLNAGDMLPMVRLQNGTPTLYQIPPSLLRQRDQIAHRWGLRPILTRL